MSRGNEVTTGLKGHFMTNRNSSQNIIDSKLFDSGERRIRAREGITRSKTTVLSRSRKRGDSNTTTANLQRNKVDYSYRYTKKNIENQRRTELAKT